MSNLKGWYSKKTDDWATPSYMYKWYMDKGYFDPCPLNPTFNGLEIDWKDLNFVNPPYSQLKRWIEKSIEEHRKGRAVHLLIPARTDTKAFKLLFDYGCNFIFLTGRLKFNDKGSAPFPSVVVVLTGEENKIFNEDKEKWE